eukprot:2717657-Amphidinium_carterae.1
MSFGIGETFCCKGSLFSCISPSCRDVVFISYLSSTSQREKVAFQEAVWMLHQSGAGLESHAAFAAAIGDKFVKDCLKDPA